MFVLISFVLTLIVILISIIYYKLTFWSRQGIPNDLTSRVDLPFHFSDLRSHQKYGKVVGFYEGLRPTLSVTDPNLIKRILVTDFHKFGNHREFVSPREELYTSLFFLPYSKWKRTRTILSPTFSTSKMKQLEPLMISSLDQLVEKLEEKANKNSIIDLRLYFDCLAFDVISKTALGAKVGAMDNPENPLFKAAKLMFETNEPLKKLLVFAFPFLSKYFDYLFLSEISQKTIAKNVRKVIDERIAKNIEKTDLLQLAIDSSQLSNKPIKTSFERLKIEEIVSNSLNILGAGYETTSTQLCFICRFLALNPKYQEILLNEINSTFDKPSDISYDKLMKMTHLDAFVKEIMRINSSVNRIDRIATKDCFLENIFIPKGTAVIIPIWALHLDADNFEEPEVFNLNRFLPENVENIKDYTYMPFATGPRNCIGMRFALMEIKYTLLILLTKFRFEACDQTKELDYYLLNQVANMKNLYLKLSKR